MFVRKAVVPGSTPRRRKGVLANNVPLQVYMLVVCWLSAAQSKNLKKNKGYLFFFVACLNEQHMRERKVALLGKFYIVR